MLGFARQVHGLQCHVRSLKSTIVFWAIGHHPQDAQIGRHKLSVRHRVIWILLGVPVVRINQTQAVLQLVQWLPLVCQICPLHAVQSVTTGPVQSKIRTTLCSANTFSPSDAVNIAGLVALTAAAQRAELVYIGTLNAILRVHSTQTLLRSFYQLIHFTLAQQMCSRLEPRSFRHNDK